MNDPTPPPAPNPADVLMAQARELNGKLEALQMFILWVKGKDPNFLTGQTLQTLMATPSFEAYFAGFTACK